MTKDELKLALSQPDGAQKLMPQAEKVFEGAWELFLEGDRSACAFLCRCAKRTSFARRIQELLAKDRTPLHAALVSQDAKLRKNAARLCALVGEEADVEALQAALAAETQRFVRPSYLLALGAIGTESAKATLNAYTVSPAASPAEQKHADEEAEALRIARAKFAGVQKHGFCGLSRAYTLELRCPKWLSEVAAEELRSLGFAPSEVFSDAVRVKTRDTARLFEARCFSEALFCVADNCSPTPKAVAFKAAAFLRELLLGTHSGEGPFGYRIELRAEQTDRGAFAKELSALLDGKDLVNAPSEYEAELRVEIRSNGGANVYVKLFTLPDTRFSYRIGALPASIQPSVAAAVLRSAKDFLKPDARVLDPCCGSGTLLFEREKLLHCASLTGVDIAHKAVEIARENAAAGGSEAKFIANDCMRFEAHRKYDEVISNLPFGNRVGSHTTNERLYFALLNRLPLWLSEDGTAILYTMEFTLMKKLLRENPRLRLASEAKTNAGGLMPGIFVIKLK